LATPSSYPTNSLLAFEIAQQPELWPTTLQRVPSDWTANAMPGPAILTGAGTSAHAAAAIAQAWPGARAIPTTDLLLRSADELQSAIPSLHEAGGVLISLARSGDSPESVGVVEKFQRLFPQVQHLAIVCNPDGRLAHTQGVNVILLDPRTNDRSLAMTGSFSNLTLAGLALQHRARLAESVPEICRHVTQNLRARNHVIADIARSCGDRIVILTSSMHALSMEASLKIIELTDGRVIATTESFLGLRHGAVGLLREDTPVVCFLSSDPRKKVYELDLLDDLRGKGLGRLVIVGDDPDLAASEEWYLPAMAPGLPDDLRTPFEITIAQLLAYHLSVASGVDPDNPSPKGTITRVVRPFRLHPEVDVVS